MRRIVRTGILAVAAFGFVPQRTHAQPEEDPMASVDSAPRTEKHKREDAEPHPELSDDASWVPIMMIVVGGMFVAAATIGPIVRANTPDEPAADAHGHDDHPAARSHDDHGHH